MTANALSSSFRDPSGFLFESEGVLFRQVNPSYREEYEHLIRSGLYAALVSEGLLVAHEEVTAPRMAPGAWRVLRPVRVPFISYPYEWCFGELKAAALATLEIQRRSLRHGMILKDSSAFNIQFVKGKPVLIDTLSFRRYAPGEPWEAYRQFCEHFLAPLALMSLRDPRLGQWSRIDIGGVPLDLASLLLPRRTWLSFSLLSHVHLHARTQKHYESRHEASPARSRSMGKYGLDGLIASLEGAVRRLEYPGRRSTWSEYYDNTNYGADSLEHKKAMVSELIRETSPRQVWDLGANVGLFSRIAADSAEFVAAFDNDQASVEGHYRNVVSSGAQNVLPLVLDLTNPSAGIGFANAERLSLADRGPVDLVMALALIHHLAIGNNVPLASLAAYFSTLCRSLIIEFVPKQDSQVQRMLASRPDVFANYDQSEFERAFDGSFQTLRRIPLRGTERTLYLMRRRSQSG